MDAIAYAHADKQQQRIKKLIEEPDSTSGLVTMPSTIAVGETVTIPAGRVVVHPNLQIDGTLDIQGDLFIPSGGTSDQLVSKSGDTMTGNLGFNITPETSLHINSSGTGVAPGGNQLIISGDQNKERISVRSSITSVVQVAKCSGLYSAPIAVNSGDFLGGFQFGGYGQTVWTRGAQIAGYAKGTWTDTSCPADIVLHTCSSGSAALTERLRIDTSGNVLVTGSGGLGYGTGSGGTVTQLISKGTLVTLDKPCGMITMNNASLAGGAIAQFQVNNSRCGAYDKVDVWVMGGTGSLQLYDTWASPFNTNGAFYVDVKNITGGALAEAVQIGFSITKGAIA